MIRLLVAMLFLVACNENVTELDHCEEWTWIDDEHCAMEVCAEEGYPEFECRDGDCWCCDGEECTPEP